MRTVLELIRSPSSGAAMALERGRLSAAAAATGVATVVAATSVGRFAAEVRVEDLMFGPERSPLVATLLSLIGRDLTSVVLHLVELSWAALLIVTALTPMWIWLLGASAVHAAARLSGRGRAFRPMLVLFGLATGITRTASDLIALALGGRGSQIAQLAGLLALGWLGIIALRGIERHYGVGETRAFAILAVAVVLFYLVPLLLIVAAVIAIIVAALALDYFPS